MQIMADALDLDLHIYQNNSGCVQLFNFTSQKPTETVYLKFTHYNKHLLGNHYDAITKVNSNMNLHLVSKVAEQVLTSKPAETFIDLTEDDGRSDKTYIFK